MEDGKITVLVFLATDCPISQKYVPVLNALQEKYAGEPLVVQAIVPSENKRAVKRFRREYAIAFPIQTDKSFACVKATSAVATPEVFVFDAYKQLRYRGAINNWFYELGRYRQQATEHYLTDAVESLLAGTDVRVTSTTAIGCPIAIP